MKAFETAELAERLQRLEMMTPNDRAQRRSVEARIIKLEARRQRPNEVLLVWRKPGQPVKEAIAGADLGHGDRDLR